MTDKHRDISGSSLKLIAISAMLTDHIAACIIWYFIEANPHNFYEDGTIRVNTIYIVYMVMRVIGRTAFPIFIFLLIEGFRHTSDRLKYLGRLSGFALLSEIPFDMAAELDYTQIRRGCIIEAGYQNVFFTLAIGLFTIMLMDAISHLNIDSVGGFWLKACAVLFGAALAYALHTDYGAVGVTAIAAAYVFRKNIYKQMTAVCLVLTASGIIEAVAFLTIIPISGYRGRRGIRAKWLFYLFYPVHLILIAVVKYAMIQL